MAAESGALSFLVHMVNYHEACDTSGPLEIGAGAALAMLPPGCEIRVVRPAKTADAETSTEAADMVFTDRRVEPSFFSRVLPSQVVNRIPFLDKLTLKTSLAEVLQDYDADLRLPGRGSVYPWGYWATEIAPMTFRMPEHRALIKEIVDASHRPPAACSFPFQQAPFYICKPNDGSNGRGIEIVPGLQGVLDLMAVVAGKTDAGFDGTYVVQPYVPNPALYHGVKFDLRVYLLMVGSGCEPDPAGGLKDAQGFLMRSGLARLCATPFEPITEANRGVATMHIANEGVNAPTAERVFDIQRTIAHVFETLAESGAMGSVDTLWEQLAKVGERVLTAFQHRIRKLAADNPVPFADPAQHGRCYQLLGMDVMVDATGRMWLMEVNAKPCMDWNPKETERLYAPVVNTEVMALALGAGLGAARPEIDTVRHSALMQERTIPLRVGKAARLPKVA